MANYIYSDEDNAPMSMELFDRIDQDGHNPTVYGSYAEMVAVEKGLSFTDPTPADKNCHERCRYSKECWKLFNCKGSNRADFPDECAMYYKLDDLAMEAMDIEKEQRKARGEDDELPFTDDYDGPEETGEF